MHVNRKRCKKLLIILENHSKVAGISFLNVEEIRRKGSDFVKKENNTEDEELDLSFGGVGLGEYMKSNSRWGIVTTVAAIIAAIASIVATVASVMALI